MDKVFVFKEPQSLKDIDLSCFCLKSDERELSDNEFWLKISQMSNYFNNISFSLEIHNGDGSPFFRHNGWTLMGNDSCINQKWSIVLFKPTIIDPYGSLVEFGNIVTCPEVYMRCYKSDDYRIYLCFLFRQFVHIADDFVTAGHYYLYDNSLSQYNGNTFYNRMAEIIQHVNGECESYRPMENRVWISTMIRRCQAMLLSPIAPSIESGKFSIKEALNRYESARAKMR